MFTPLSIHSFRHSCFLRILAGVPELFVSDFVRQIVDSYNAGKPKREIMGELESMRLGAAARTVDGFA